MNPSSIAAFNLRKNAETRGQLAAQVEFTKQRGVLHEVGFGTATVEGTLGDTGGVSLMRAGVLEFPVIPESPLAYLATFEIRSLAPHRRDKDLIGTRWKIITQESNPLESIVKCTCERIEECPLA